MGEKGWLQFLPMNFRGGNKIKTGSLGVTNQHGDICNLKEFKKKNYSSIFLSFCLWVWADNAQACVRARTQCSLLISLVTQDWKTCTVSPVTYGRWLRPVSDSWGISLNICLTLTIHRVQRRGLKLLPFAGSILSVLETGTSFILIIVVHFLFICCTTVWGAACTTCNIIPS